MKALILLSLIFISTAATAGDKIMDLLATRWATAQARTEEAPAYKYLKRIELEYSDTLGSRAGHHSTESISVLAVADERIHRTYCGESETTPGMLDCQGDQRIIKYIASVPYLHSFSGGFGSYSTLFTVIVDKKWQWNQDQDGNETNRRETINYSFSEEIE